MATYRPGQEPDRIKARIMTLFAKLDEAYPDRVIRGLYRDHKNWAETVTELYRLLGYESGTAFLEAYDYKVETGAAGRSSGDPMAVIEELKRRYPNGPEITKVGDLQKANPDLSAKIKTLNNLSGKLFGMSLGDYLKSAGILNDDKADLENRILELKKRYPEGCSLPATLAEIKQDNADLKISSIDQRIRTVLGREPIEYLQERGLLAVRQVKAAEEKPSRVIVKRPKREELRYNPTDKVIRSVYSCGEHKVSETGEELYKALEDVLLEKGTAQQSREKVAALARSGNVKGYDTAYFISEAGDRITMAVNLILPPSNARERLFNGFSVGPIDIVRDIVCRVSGFFGLVAMNDKGKIAGAFPWNYANPISPLLDLGKAGIENAGLEENFSVVFDLVLSDGKLSRKELGPESAEDCFIPKPASLPEVEPFDYNKIKSWGKPDPRRHACTFSNGAARGTAEELNALAEACYSFGAPLTPTRIPGIYEMSMKDFFPYNDGGLYLKNVIEKFPGLKVVGFLEDWSMAAEVWVLYSESGYPFVTEGTCVGHFDYKSDLLWQREYGPTEDFTERFEFIQSGVPMTIRYKFPYRKKWLDRNYYRIENGSAFRMTANGTPKKLPYNSPELWKLKRSSWWVGHSFIQEYLGDETDVRFPEKVGDQVILGIAARKSSRPANYAKIEHITLPDSYFWIGAHAFQGCASLQEVRFPRDLFQIGDEAFADCTALKKVEFNKICRKKYESRNVAYAEVHEKKAIGENLFKNCTSLEQVILKSAMTEVSESGTFPNCGNYVITGATGGRDSYAALHNVGHIQDEKDRVPERLEFIVSSQLRYQELPAVGEILMSNDGAYFRDNGTEVGKPLSEEELPYPLPEKAQVISVKPFDWCWGVTVCTVIDDALARKTAPSIELDDPEKQSLSGKVFVPDKMTYADQLTGMIQERGGTVKPNVVLSTDYLIINPDLEGRTVRQLQALELLRDGKTNLRIISYEEFFEMIRKK